MFAPVADHAQVGLFVSGKDGSLIFVNDRWCELAGVSAAEAVGNGWVHVIHPDDRQRVVDNWAACVAARLPYTGECRYVRPDGSIIWVEANGLPVDDPQAGQVGYMGTCIETTERRRTEERTKLYEALLSGTPDLAYVFAPDESFVYANRALLAMWGKTWEEAEGKRCIDLGYEPWHAEMHGREIAQVIATKQPVRGEVPFVGTNGRRIYDYILTPVFGEDGDVYAVAGITRDVTERKEAEQRALILAELAGRLAPLGSEAAIMKATVETVGRFFNAQRCYFVECLKAENIVRISHNWVRDGVATTEGQFPLDQFGGDEWWAKYSSGPWCVEDVTTDPLTSDRVEAYLKYEVRSFATLPYRKVGAWTAILAVTYDHPRKWTAEDMEFLDNAMARVWPLIEQARSLQAIRTSRQRLAILADMGRHILEAETPRDMLRVVCTAAAEHLGADIGMARLTPFPGHPGEIGYHSGIPLEIAEEIAELYLGDSCRSPEETESRISSILRREGARAIATDRLMAREEMLGVMVFAGRDRTPFSFHELEFLDTLSHYVNAACVRMRLVESLREADRRKDLFLATLAHELRNPLAPILTGLEIMQRSARHDPAMVDHVTGIIGRQTGQMARLVDDLLDISRVNTGKIILRREPVEFAEIIRNALEASQPFCDERGHVLEVVMPPEGAVVDADPTRVAQVLTNLLSNAAKYTPESGRIRLETGVASGDAWMTVTDNGQGIDLADQSSIFELFHQSSGGRKDGLGIGLTLVKSLVEMHGGSVQVASEGRGKGSEFRVNLPGCVLEAGSAPAKDSGPAFPTGAKRVLVVDDGRNAADMLVMFFRMEGMEAEAAYDGREGLEKTRTFQPDFVIMDIGMPVMDGLEAARRMREENVRARLIALSGWGREEDKNRTAEAGFDHHMTKPVSPKELREVLLMYS